VLAFLVRRLGFGLLVVWLVSLLSWLVFASALNPLTVFFPNFHSKQALAAVARGHLHEPLLVRYWYWLEGLFTGKGFGVSVAYGDPVWQLVGPAFYRTLELLGASLLVVLLVSVAIGFVSARRNGSALDVGLRTFAYVTWSTPAFLLALLVQHWFVAMDASWHFQPFSFSGPPAAGGGFVDWLRHMTLPALAVGFGLAGAYARLLRSSLLATMGMPYVGVARAKGLPERRVVLRHALRNALVPFTTLVAFDFGALVGATLAVDYVFGLQGLASTFLLRGLTPADPHVLEAELVLVAALVVAAGILADVLCAWLDPRLRLD